MGADQNVFDSRAQNALLYYSWFIYIWFTFTDICHHRWFYIRWSRSKHTLRVFIYFAYMLYYVLYTFTQAIGNDIAIGADQKLPSCYSHILYTHYMFTHKCMSQVLIYPWELIKMCLTVAPKMHSCSTHDFYMYIIYWMICITMGDSISVGADQNDSCVLTSHIHVVLCVIYIYSYNR